MSTASTFLGYVQVFIKINGMVGTGVDTALAAGALYRVDDDQAVISLIYSTFYGAGRDTRCLIAMHTEDGEIMHLDLGYGASDKLILLQPELTCVWLRLGIRSPVISHMLVLAGNLTAVAAITSGDVDNESLCHFLFTSFFDNPGIEAKSGTWVIFSFKCLRVVLSPFIPFLSANLLYINK